MFNTINSVLLPQMCWKTEASLKKYKLIVATQASAIQHNLSESEVRIQAMQHMQSVLDKKLKQHDQAVSSFFDVFLLELSRRDTVSHVSHIVLYSLMMV